jgi:signal transduction histidine kinase
LEQRTQSALEALVQMAQVLVQDFASQAPLETGPARLSHELMQGLASLTQKVLGCHRLGIVGVEPETELLYPLAVVGLSPELEKQWWQEQEQQNVRLSESTDPAMLKRFRAQEVVVIDLTQPPYSELPNPYNIKQMLAAPIVLGTRILGFFTMDYGGLDHTYTPEEIELTKAVTRFAALVMERERLLTEAALARADELAFRETASRLDTFMGIVSHELKTPLTSIKGNLQLANRRLKKMLQQSSDAEQRQLGELQNLLDRAERQVRVQDRLVSDLLDLSRIQAEKLELYLAKVDLVKIVQDAIEDQRLVAGSHPLRVDLPEEKEVFVIADTIRVGQTLGNYLSNALKYSFAEQPVEIRLTVEKGQAWVAVIDHGPGLSPEQQRHLWERFYRVPGITVQSGSSVGLGLGLYISRMLIEQQGGKVGVESVVGQGAMFWFTLPLADFAIKPDLEVSEYPQAFVAEPGSTTPVQA